MLFIKKFYDTGVAESGGGADAEVIEAPVIEQKQEKPPTFAEAMAKGGVKTTIDNKAVKPVVNKTEKKEESKAVEEVKKVETTAPSNEAKANSESLPLKEEKEEVTPPQKEAVTHTSPSWQEVLKGQQPDNVLKELGFDDKTVKVLNKLKGFEKIDFFNNLIDEWKTKGDLKAYLKELTTDYQKMSPEEVMRHQLQEEYPKANAATLNALFKKKVVEAYNLDSEDDALAEEGKMLLEAEADKYRDKFVEVQKGKLFPEVPEAAPPEPDRQAEKAQQEFDAYMSAMDKDPYAEKVWVNKEITIGKGEDKITMKVDPQAIKNVLYDSEKWTETQFEKIKQSDGTFKYTPKSQNQILTAQFALDPEKFINDILQRGKAIGGKKAIDPIINAKPPDNNTISHSEIAPANLAEGMAKGGVLKRGGE